MKEIRKEAKREVIDVTISYEAVDGTLFISKDECIKYENSAFGVLMGRTKEFTIQEGDSTNPFDDSGENEFKMLKPRNKEDIDVINQLFLLPRNGEAAPRFTDVHIGKLILMGWRITCRELEWTWFYDMEVAIASLTNNLYNLTPKA